MALSKILPFSLLFVLLIITLWMTTALARPRVVATGNCLCTCFAGTGVEFRVYGPTGGTCDLYNGKTCNIEDPETRGIRSGRLEACDAEMVEEKGALKTPRTKVQPRITTSGANQGSGTMDGVRLKSTIQRQP